MIGQHELVSDLRTVVIQGEFLNDLINDLLNVSKAMSGKELALNLADVGVVRDVRREAAIDALREKYGANAVQKGLALRPRQR